MEGWSVGCVVRRGVVVALGMIADGVWPYGFVELAWIAVSWLERRLGEFKGVRETHGGAPCWWQRNM